MNLNKKLLVVALASAFAQSAQAVERLWNTSHFFGFLCDGSFTNVDCWGAGGNPAPGLNDIATWNFNHASPFTVTFSGNITNQKARIRQDYITWALNGHTYSLTTDNSVTNPSLAVGINNGETGRLTIRNGTVNAARTVLAINGSSNGYLTLGDNATLNAGTGLTVGYWEFTTAALSVLGGSRLNSSGTADIGFNATANGSVLVTGTGSRWDTTGHINIGSSTGGTGFLEAGPGGVVAAGSLTVWNGSSSIRTGTTASATGGIIDIAGALTLQGGGDAFGYYGFVDNIYAGTDSGIYANTATIGSAGTDSRWETAYHHTGFSGTGTLTVNSGGTLKSTNTYVGTNFGANGTLNINAGGGVDTDGNGFLGFNSGATGAATVGGALWDVGGGLYVGGNDLSSGGTGTLTVNTGGKVKAGSLTVWNGSSSIKTGTTASTTGGIIDIAGALTLQGGGKVTGYYGLVDGSYTGNFSGIYAGSATTGGTGTDSRWDTALHFTGYTGTGTLNVNSDGTLKSTDTYVGTLSGANGTLNINADGFVDTGGNGILGFNPGATGAATVGGTGAQWDVAGGLYRRQ
ncbi:MAG: hypothetical protein IPK39_15655 [Sulfuritalea sp.]|nr:hypothetical protein [Sulfuritalea sp.]